MALTALVRKHHPGSSRAVFSRLVMPLVALAAGSLLGGSLFHLLPGAVTLPGNDLGVYGWVAGGMAVTAALTR